MMNKIIISLLLITACPIMAMEADEIDYTSEDDEKEYAREWWPSYPRKYVESPFEPKKFDESGAISKFRARDLNGMQTAVANIAEYIPMVPGGIVALVGVAGISAQDELCYSAIKNPLISCAAPLCTLVGAALVRVGLEAGNYASGRVHKFFSTQKYRQYLDACKKEHWKKCDAERKKHAENEYERKGIIEHEQFRRVMHKEAKDKGIAYREYLTSERVMAYLRWRGARHEPVKK